MKHENGRFTKEEQDYLQSLDAVSEVRAKYLIYSNTFKKELIRTPKSREALLPTKHRAL